MKTDFFQLMRRAAMRSKSLRIQMMMPKTVQIRVVSSARSSAKAKLRVRGMPIAWMSIMTHASKAMANIVAERGQPCLMPQRKCNARSSEPSLKVETTLP